MQITRNKGSGTSTKLGENNLTKIENSALFTTAGAQNRC